MQAQQNMWLDRPQLLTQPGEAAVSMALKIGLASNLLREIPLPNEYGFSYLNAIVEPAIRHRCIKFYFDSRGNEVGYIVWALLDPGAEKYYTGSGQWILHLSCWNEGDELWVIDVVANSGCLLPLLHDFVSNIGKSYSKIHYVRKKKGSFVFKGIFTERILTRC